MSALLDEAALSAVALELGHSLEPGEVVWLTGELGAGKTTFVKSLVQGLGVGAAATSPTYSLVHQYVGTRGPVYHVDCYRLSRPDDAYDLDWETLSRGDVLLIEWPERAGAWAPRPTRTVSLAHTPDPEVRRLELA